MFWLLVFLKRIPGKCVLEITRLKKISSSPLPATAAAVPSSQAPTIANKADLPSKMQPVASISDTGTFIQSIGTNQMHVDCRMLIHV